MDELMANVITSRAWDGVIARARSEIATASHITGFFVLNGNYIAADLRVDKRIEYMSVVIL